VWLVVRDKDLGNLACVWCECVWLVFGVERQGLGTWHKGFICARKKVLGTRTCATLPVYGVHVCVCEKCVCARTEPRRSVGGKEGGGQAGRGRGKGRWERERDSKRGEVKGSRRERANKSI
jgi:hypothetical protein